MLSLDHLTAHHAARLEGLLFDLDDTFLDRGKLSEAAYSALFRLKDSGLRLIALTGRPASWGELAARLWPIDAAITENGALAFESDGTLVVRRDTATFEERKRRQSQLSALVQEARQRIPELVPANDVAGRVSDYTFDIGETQNASQGTIAAARELAQAHGARTTQSSVHLHYTFDCVDKATGALSYLQARGDDPSAALRRYAFIGDSDNDASCFAAFFVTVGVANCRGSFSLPPRFRTQAERGAGFAELAEHLVRLRAAGPPTGR